VPGLFDSLSSASHALAAHRLGLDVAGQNLANINTVGYARRMIMQAELPPTHPLSAGRGVEVTGIVALRDLLVEGRLRREQQDASADAAIVASLVGVEAAIALPGESLDAQLAAFFDAFGLLADDPMSPVARDAVVQRGGDLARAFGDMVARLENARREADNTVRAGVADINAMTAELASLNVQIARSGHDVEALKDRQLSLLGELSELADIAVLSRADGGVDVTLSSGRAIVIGENDYALQVVPGAVAGISLEGVDVTAELRGGRLGGLIHVRDTVLPGYVGRLDQLAYDLAAAVNTTHGAGFDASGNPAGDFFAPLGGVAGAAAALAVDPAIQADSGLVAASSTGAVGDNQTARALAALREAPVTAGGTLDVFEAWSEFMFVVGSDVAAARAAESGHQLVVRQLEGLRTQTSGVSYDEEAAHLMRYQRAYEASARYFTTIVDTIDTLMEMVR
jgi:flagellar hook-associated protein 1 FlgK